MFAAVLSVLLLLVAMEPATTGWWVAYGLSLASVVYTHYTGVYVVLAQLGWALWADAHLAERPADRVHVCHARIRPWVPSVKGEKLDVYAGVAKFLGADPHRRADQLDNRPALRAPRRDARPGVAHAAGICSAARRRRPARPRAVRPPAIRQDGAGLPAGRGHPDRDLRLLGRIDDLFLFLATCLRRCPSPGSRSAGCCCGCRRSPRHRRWRWPGWGWRSAPPERSRTPSPGHYPQLAHYIDDAAAGPRDVVLYQSSRALAVTASYPLSLYFNRPTRRRSRQIPVLGRGTFGRGT